MNDDTSVLVVYASRHGSTKGVAERIATRLGEQLSRVELEPAGRAGSPEAYDAVVFGSAVYDQSWLPEGEEFVRGHQAALAGRPVWLFSVGTFSDRKRLVGPLMKKEPRGIEELRRTIEPRDYRVFAGVIDRRQWPFVSRLLYWALGGRLGDNRDWRDIEAWADDIAGGLATATNP